MVCKVRWPALGCMLFLGCDGGPTSGVEPVASPRSITGMEVEWNPGNVLSASVTFEAEDADSAQVWYRAAGDSLGSWTPVVTGSEISFSVPVLGLRPETTYFFRPVAHWGEVVVGGEVAEFETGTLPEDLPSFVAGGPDPSPGFILFASGRYGIVIDNDGRVVWYHEFPNGPGLNFQAQPNGRYTARPSGQYWVEINPVGELTRLMGCAGNLASRPHDLLAEPDGSYWILCDQDRTVDLSSAGGHSATLVRGTVVQHRERNGDLLFEWSPFDHFEVADLDPAQRIGSFVNWTHGNSLDLDGEGHLLISFRNLNEITRIHRESGEVIWRMGGARNDFTFPEGPGPLFLGQHGIRKTGPGRLLVLDNLGDPGGTRALRIEYDADSRIAHPVGSFATEPPVVAQLGGTVQDLPTGRTLVAFGNGGRVAEFDAAGNVVWEIQGDPGYVFRAQRILSLYSPGVGLPR
jgi:hypothetical protein